MGRFILGLTLLAGLVAAVGPGPALEAARRVRPGWGLAVMTVGILWLALGAVNVWILLRKLGPIPFRAFIGVYVTSWLMSLVIPGQLGDSVQLVLLRRWKVPVSRSGAAYIVDKAVSLTWLLSVAAVGAWLYVPGTRGWWLIVAPAAILCLGAALILSRGKAPNEAAPRGRIRSGLTRLAEQIRTFRSYPGTLAANVGLTGIKWLVTGGLYLLSFRAFGVFLPSLAAATIPIMASLVGYLPVTVGGAGTMELTAVFLFGTLGVDAPTVVVAYLFLRIVLLISALLLFLGAPGAALPEGRPSAS